MSARAPERGLLPIALPILLLGMIAGVAFLFSRVLLNVHKDIAIAVALAMAFNLMAFFSFMSSRIGRADPIEKVMALGVLLLPVVLGAAVAVKIIPIEGGAEAGHGEQKAANKATLVAKDLAFDKAEVELTAGTDAEIDVDNRDTQPHNVVVFNGADASAAPLNDGQPFANPGQRVAYTFKAPAPGTYFFHCAIHPAQMTGKVVTKEGAAAGKEGGGAAALSLVAKDLKFDKSELKAKAGEKVTLNFESKEAQPHNVQVFPTAEPTGTPILQGQPLMAAGKTKYSFTAPAAPGKYAYDCQFHPTTMKGTLVVE